MYRHDGFRDFEGLCREKRARGNRDFEGKQRYNSEGNLSVLFVQKQRARESVEIQRYGD